MATVAADRGPVALARPGIRLLDTKRIDAGAPPRGTEAALPRRVRTCWNGLMGDRGTEHDPDTALLALVALIDRVAIVARPVGPAGADASPDVLVPTLAAARIVAVSRAAALRGAAVGMALGDALPSSALRSGAEGAEGSPLRLVHEGGLVSLVLYADEAQATAPASQHGELRRWAHDLANTFMTITGHAQLLRRHVAADDESGQRSLDRILEAVERASTRIRDRVGRSSQEEG